MQRRESVDAGWDGSSAGSVYSPTGHRTRRSRAGAFLAALVFQGGIVLLLVRGLNASGYLPSQRLSIPIASEISLSPPEPSPTHSERITSSPKREQEGRKGMAAREAKATEVVVPPSLRMTRSPVPATVVPSTGDDSRSGASTRGEGRGGATAGSGTGSGSEGQGSGGRYVASRPVKIAGDITSARDYPESGRDARLGRRVVIALTVGTNGRATGCKVYKTSGDAAADAVTCRLATERFRFRPATDQNGNLVEAIFGWEQRWYSP